MGGTILEFHSNLKRPRAHDNYLVLSENSMLNDPATSHILKDPLWFKLQPSEDKVHAHQSNSVTQHGDASSLSHSFLGQWVGACLCFNLLTKPSMVGWKKEWKVKTHSSPHPINHIPPPGLVHIGNRSLAFCRRLKVTRNGTSNWAITRRGRISLWPHTHGRCSYRKSNVLKCPGISTPRQ